jgi:tetratricopeptide (TPR) repeat protein
MKKSVIQLTALLLALFLAAPGLAPAQQADADLAKKINAGYDLLEQGKFPQAQKLYEEVLQKHPDHPLALNNLAAIMCKQGNYDQALAHLKRALPQAKGYKITLNRVCNVQGVCAAYRMSDTRSGQDPLEDLIKLNILMINMTVAERRPGK